ncbi:hypothetical protein TNCV_2411571 [Trichonephila clavipes]|nr:hypothetical protein TNCV_2411571 [Trichonephila clavipes]
MVGELAEHPAGDSSPDSIKAVFGEIDISPGWNRLLREGLGSSKSSKELFPLLIAFGTPWGGRGSRVV